MTDNMIGTQIDEYLLEALLGEGGMARVYRGRDVYLQRYAAIKVITPTFRQEKDYLVRFEREALAIARLDHPHIVRLYRYGEAKGLLYIAMQFIEGMDLGSVLQSYRQSNDFIEYNEAVRLIGEIGAALDYIHDQGIIHRDVKSSNIMLDKTGRAYLTDFGLVLLTEVGTRGEIFGSPHYLAPEQAISSAKAVPQSDLYSLGVIAYEMFAGQVPFDAKEPLDIAMLHMSQEPPLPRSLRPELPAELEAVLLKALAKKPEDRYTSGALLAEAVDMAIKIPVVSPRSSPSSGKTIPERVALDLANRPLPPIPAISPIPLPVANPPSISEAAESISASLFESAQPEMHPGDYDVDVKAASTSAQPTPPLGVPSTAAVDSRAFPRVLITLVSVVSILGICMVIGCLVIYALKQAGIAGFGRVALDPTPTPRFTETKRPTPSSVSQKITNTSSPSPVSQTKNTPLMLVETTVILTLERCVDEHCLSIINHSQVALPLSDLVIKGKGYSFTGTDWGIADLPPSGCLVLSGNADKWLPAQKECSPAAATLTSPENFWKKELELTYAGESYGSCVESNNTCKFTITLK